MLQDLARPLAPPRPSRRPRKVPTCRRVRRAGYYYGLRAVVREVNTDGRQVLRRARGRWDNNKFVERGTAMITGKPAESRNRRSEGQY